ncbi:MAG: hypothetical protein F4210_04820 [Holophagales bacterium]|nr:hypothetical protein [Holophagales bacterium]MYF94827.1 hypothetical protein [Holophagales bacterium]
MKRPFPLDAASTWMLAGCLTLGLAGCAEDAVEPAPPVVERPTWKPPAPAPPPKPCGVGCIEGEGNATVRFQMAGGDHTATASVEGNRGVFAVGPPVDISRNAEEWSGITTFFVPEAGVKTLRIRATGKWSLTILKGKQSYADG